MEHSCAVQVTILRPMSGAVGQFSRPHGGITGMSEAQFKEYNVLFLCAHNAGRSIMAECAMRRWGAGHFNAYSAGADPAGEVNPFAVRILKSYNYKTDNLRSKHLSEFVGDDAPRMDFVFTVCDTLHGEACPVFPGQPLTAHWPIEDPAATEGDDDRKLRAYRRAYVEVETRCKIFASLRVDALDRLTLQSSLNLIGQHRTETAA